MPRQEILIDPFHGGRILSVADCENLVQQATGDAVRGDALSLAPSRSGLICSGC